MESIVEIVVDNGGAVALLLLVFGVLTAIEEALDRYEKTSPPGLLTKVTSGVNWVLKHLTSNTDK